VHPISGLSGRIGRLARSRVGSLIYQALGRGAAGLRARLDAEQDRWLLWAPVFVGLGVYGYFSLRSEPPMILALSAPLVGLALLSLFWRFHGLRFVALMVMLAGTGIAAAKLRTIAVEGPVISRKFGPVAVTGRILTVEPRQHGVRILLDRLSIDRLARSDTPDRIRITARVGWDGLRPGQLITARTILLPTRPPVAPGAMDFQRRAYFQRIGASGFVIAAPVIVREADTGWLVTAIERWRNGIARRISRVLGGDVGAVANALLTGHRGAISPEAMEAIRSAGLAHLLAISGLHIGMVGGIVFFIVWFGLALFPGVALRWPTRKIAAVAALAAAFAYLLLTGGTIPTQRAFLMLAVVMTGVLIGRVAISMRLVAAAAVVLLLMSPESLMTASFQMSFAAVIALVAAYEAWSRRSMRGGAGSRFSRPVRGLIGIGATSLIAGVATGPFAVFHFQRLALYGLIANLAVVPVVSFFVLPFGLLALLVMPLGLEGPPLWLMARGIELMLWVSRSVAGLPGALALAPAPAIWGMVLIVAGGLWLALWQTRWRLAGVAVIVMGTGSTLFSSNPDILISPTGKLIATRTSDGALAVSTARRGRFIARVWLEGEAQRLRRYWRKDKYSAVRCDALGCVYNRGRWVVAFPAGPAALAEDCGRATIIVADFAVRRRCPTVRRTIDLIVLSRKGSHAIWLERGGIRIRTDHDIRGDRPWISRPPLPTRRIRIAAGGKKSSGAERRR